MEFDATEYIDVGSSSALTHPGSEFTAEAWIYWDGTNIERNIIISTHTHSNNGWDIQINTNNQWMILHRTSNGSDVSASSSDSATVGWHHIAGVFTNIGQVVSVNLYVDGSLVAANSQNGTFANDGTEHLFIGNINEPIYGHPSSVRQFYGLIGMAKISSSSVYNGEFTPQMFNVDSQTVALWELSSGGNISEDQSGNGHDGTINGATWVNTCPEEDLDGDGVPAWEDCDDGDASVGSSVDDADCDGVTVSAGDCNDNDASIYPFAGDTYGDGVDSDCDGLDCEASYNGTTYLTVCSQNGNNLSWSDSYSSCESAGYDGLATLSNNSDQSFLYSMIHQPTCNIWVNPTNQPNNNPSTGCQEIDWNGGSLDPTSFCGSQWSNCQYACEKQ